MKILLADDRAGADEVGETGGPGVELDRVAALRHGAGEGQRGPLAGGAELDRGGHRIARIPYRQPLGKPRPLPA